MTRHRDKVIIATKFGNEIGPDGARTGKVNGGPDYLRSSVEAPCTDSPSTPSTSTTSTAWTRHPCPGDLRGELVQQGKLCFLGISEASPDSIRRARPSMTRRGFAWGGRCLVTDAMHFEFTGSV